MPRTIFYDCCLWKSSLIERVHFVQTTYPILYNLECTKSTNIWFICVIFRRKNWGFCGKIGRFKRQNRAGGRKAVWKRKNAPGRVQNQPLKAEKSVFQRGSADFGYTEAISLYLSRFLRVLRCSWSAFRFALSGFLSGGFALAASRSACACLSSSAVFCGDGAGACGLFCPFGM